ncbi:MAG: hypothetical protein JWN46_2679 [Acidimicrobiales bacterium]|nr:hypothetical protein [Acidimicrobiales bacterium]
MIGRFFRRIVVLALVGTAVAAAVRLLRGDAAPAFQLPTEPIQLRPAAPSAPVAAVPSTPTTDEVLATSPPDEDSAEPIEGGCPDGFPVKAKLKSGVFREPGMANYESTTPDRCYRTAAAAEADGLRAAKR